MGSEQEQKIDQALTDSEGNVFGLLGVDIPERPKDLLEALEEALEEEQDQTYGAWVWQCVGPSGCRDYFPPGNLSHEGRPSHWLEKVILRDLPNEGREALSSDLRNKIIIDFKSGRYEP